jgi:hypothetical protein
MTPSAIRETPTNGCAMPMIMAYHGIRLITFLIGQPQLLTQKAGFQMSGDEQIVARFMIEQLLFHGIRDATVHRRATKPRPTILA